MALNELSSAAVNSITAPSISSELFNQRPTRHSVRRSRFCPRCNQQCAPESFIRIGPFGNNSSTEYCTNCRQYDNLRKRQHVAIGDSDTPGSSLGSSTEETAECQRCEKAYGISAFQKLLADGRIKVLKTCQSCRSGDRYRKQRRLGVDVNHRTTNPSVEIMRPAYQNDTNNLDCADPDIHLAAVEQVQNPFACIPRAFISEYQRLQPLLLGRMDVRCPDCRALHWIDEKTWRSPKSAPRFSKCCKEGAVKLTEIQKPPEELLELYISQEPHAIDFRKNIRSYNSALAFTSVSCENSRQSGGGIVPFQVHGQVCHLHGPLEASNPGTATNAQIWFYDPETAVTIRTARFSRTHGPTLSMLTDMLSRCNPYIGLYQTAREQLLALQHRLTPVDVLFTAQMRLIQEVGADRRRENLPTASEVAAIIPDIGPDWHKRTFRDMVLTLRSGQAGNSYLQRVDPSHAAYLPLQYVLLFPHGDEGWHWNLYLQSRSGAVNAQREPLQDNFDQLVDDGIDPDVAAEAMESHKTGRLTMRNFHAYRLFTRPDSFNVIHRACRLMQQYIVDAWATIDQSNLRWISSHQTEIRADLYNGEADVAAVADAASDQVGKRIVLPSNYVGSERFMQSIFHDGMAITGHFGRPVLFITFTANPNWVEIQDALLPGQTVMDRPDLVARVFHLKAKALREELFNKGIFGRAIARTWTIEYQKRGLPHMHLLLWLENRHFYLYPETIDQIISAELPAVDWNNDPELVELVKSLMVHNPCGGEYSDAPCMVKDELTDRKSVV